MNIDFFNDAPLLQVVEPERTTISKVYTARWYKKETDLAALARMRWINEESIGKLARYFEVAEETIKGYLRDIKRENLLPSMNLTTSELRDIQKGILRGL